MTRPARRRGGDEDEDEFGDQEDAFDPEGPGREDADLLDESQTGVRVCPECGRTIYEGAGRCNHCGHWIVRGPWDAPGRRRNKRIVIAVISVVTLAALLAWLFPGLLGLLR